MMRHHSQDLLNQSVLTAFKNLFFFLSLSLSLFAGCATTKPYEIESETRLEIATIAKDVAKRGDTSIPSGETTTFSFDDSQAVMWVKLKGLYGLHSLRWEWYDPNGNLYYKTENYQINSDGKYRRFNTSWHRILIKGEKASSLPGEWSAKLFLDGNPVAVKTFEIKGPTLKDILTGGVQAKPDRTRWAVVIGIEKYGKVPSVQFAENDAKIMEAYLKNYLGVPKENIFIRVNEIATKANIEVLIKDRLKVLLKEGDTLYFYYAGHGIPSDETPYLLPHDGDPESPGISAYAVEELYRDLDQIPAKNIFVFMDACFSGRTGRKEKESMVMAGIRPAILKVKDPLLLSKKIAVLSAAKSNQVSNYYKEEEYGLFTYYLLKGLKGDADINKDTKIQLNELAQYVEKEVSDASRRLFGISRQQNPMAMPDPLGEKGNLEIVTIYEKK